MEKWMDDVLPIMGVEHDCILSKHGDITVAFRAELPEIFTLSDNDYEAFHQAWVKAIKVLPKHSILHKQDWFIDSKYQPDYKITGDSFLSRSSERFFTERPYLDHSCYIFLTKKPAGRKNGSSLFSNLLRRTIVPEQALNTAMLQDFLDNCGQFRQILEDSGFVRLTRLKENDLYSHKKKMGIIERYCFLAEAEDQFLAKDLQFSGDKIQVGGQHCQLYTLGMLRTFLHCVAAGLIMINTAPTKQNSASVLPRRWDSCFPVTISITNMSLSKTHKRHYKNWKAKDCGCNLFLHTAGRTVLPGMPPMTF